MTAQAWQGCLLRRTPPSTLRGKKTFLRPDPSQRFRDRHDRHVALPGRLQRMAHQVRRATIWARRVGDVMTVEDQPSAALDRLVEIAIDTRRIDLAIDQGRGAQELEVDDVAIDAGKDAARRAEGLGELRLAPHRRDAIGVSEIFQRDRGIDAAKMAAVSLDLAGHGGLVETDRTQVRESMAGNLVSGPVKPHDRVVRQTVPVVRGTIDQAAREIERTAAAMLLQKPGALACSAIG